MKKILIVFGVLIVCSALYTGYLKVQGEVIRAYTSVSYNSDELGLYYAHVDKMAKALPNMTYREWVGMEAQRLEYEGRCIREAKTFLDNLKKMKQITR